MQTISRRVNEGIVIDGQTTVTVVEVDAAEITLDIEDADGNVERVTLVCRQSDSEEWVDSYAEELAVC